MGFSDKERGRRLRAYAVCASAWAAVALGGLAEARQAAPAARDAAFAQMKTPTGTGGCIFLAVPTEVRREALTATLAGGAIPAKFQAAVAQATPKCSRRPYSREDTALVGAVTSTLRRSALAMLMASQFGIGQKTLDDAWTAAPEAEKAGYYAAADEFLAPGAKVTARPLDVAPLATRAGLATDAHKPAEAALRTYFVHTALSERAEAALATSRLTPG